MNIPDVKKNWQIYKGLCALFERGDKRIITVPEFLDGFAEDSGISTRSRMAQIIQAYTPDLLDEAYELGAD